VCTGDAARFVGALCGLTTALRGYPETLSPCRSAIKQHSYGNETQGDHKEQAYSA